MAKLPTPNQPIPVPPMTHMETDEEIRRAIQANQQAARKPAIPVASPVGKKAAAAPAPTAKPAEIVPFRPTARPPLCILTVFDDGKPDGEDIRIRASRFVIGRSEGDLLIPHDELISSRHVEITRQLLGGQHRWIITDLQSTNGLFARVTRTVLADRAEFLVGSGRYRFEQPGSQSPATADHPAAPLNPEGTVGWRDAAPPVVNPALVELVGNGIGNRLMLTKAEYWIGSHPGCAICRTGDPFTEPQHVHLFRDSNRAWNAQNNKTLNGLWLKVSQTTVEESCLFQIGEQRLRLKVGG